MITGDPGDMPVLPGPGKREHRLAPLAGHRPAMAGLHPARTIGIVPGPNRCLVHDDDIALGTDRGRASHVGSRRAIARFARSLIARREMVIPLSARPVEGQVPGENVHEHVGDEGDVGAALPNTPSRAGALQPHLPAVAADDRVGPTAATLLHARPEMISHSSPANPSTCGGMTPSSMTTASGP